MRLYKKAAAVLLAAAMAVSMMTACGGSTGGGSGVAEGVIYTNDVGPAEGVDKDSIKNEQLITKAADSRYVQFYQKYLTEEKLYQQVIMYSGGETATMTEAKNGNMVYQELEYDGKKEKTLTEKNGSSSYYSYLLIEDGNNKAALRQEVKTNGNGTGSMTTGTISSADVTVNGVPYYAEISRNNDATFIVCFKQDCPVPTYMFTTFNGDTMTQVYKTVCLGSDKGICDSVLSGYDVYTMNFDKSTGKYTFTDEKNAKYVAQFTESGWTVTKDGQDVTSDFQWIINKMFSNNVK